MLLSKVHSMSALNTISSWPAPAFAALLSAGALLTAASHAAEPGGMARGLGAAGFLCLIPGAAACVYGAWKRSSPRRLSA